MQGLLPDGYGGQKKRRKREKVVWVGWGEVREGGRGKRSFIMLGNFFFDNGWQGSQQRNVFAGR